MTAKLVLSDDAANPPLNVTERSTAPTSPTAGDMYLDDGTNTGSGNPGWRRYTGSVWEDVTAAGTSGSTFADNVFRIQDDGDATKQIAFQASGITTATTRTITMPDADVDLGDVGGTTFLDNAFRVQDNADNTKQVALEASGITTATTRTLSVQDIDGTILVTGGSDVVVADGGSGRSSATAYAVVCGGTTATGAHQSIASVGTSGQVLTSNGAGALPTFQNASGGGTSIAILVDSKTTGTDGGGCSATTWNARDLNTELADPDGIVSIATNQFTPASGTYRLTAHAPARMCNRHRLRLYNVTGTAVVQEGAAAFAAAADTTATTALLSCRFTANGTDAYRIDHYTASAKATDGLGISTGDGAVEIYLVIVLEQE